MASVAAPLGGPAVFFTMLAIALGGCSVAWACSRPPPRVTASRAAPRGPATSLDSTYTAHSSDFILSKLLELAVVESAQRRLESEQRMLESEQRRLESEQRRLESTLRSVHVQLWDAPISSMVELRISFEHFFVKALAAVKVTGAARLYMIRDEKWAVRQPLTSESYAAFLEQSQNLSTTLPDIYVFVLMSGTHTSPLEPPAGHEQEVLVAEEHGEEEHVGASHARSSAMQADFRHAVSLRDGSLCVLCRDKPPLEAAHIIARIAEQSELDAAGLLSSNVPNNGIMLCIPCHRLHDAFMWCYDPSRGVVVADALLNDVELGPAWSQRVGLHLSRPDAADAVKAAWWPPASVWAAGVTRFEAAKIERHAEADERPFSCGICRKRYKRATGVTMHTCGQVQRQLYTPESVRVGSAGGGASVGGTE